MYLYDIHTYKSNSQPNFSIKITEQYYKNQFLQYLFQLFQIYWIPTTAVPYEEYFLLRFLWEKYRYGHRLHKLCEVAERNVALYLVNVIYN